MFVPRNICDWVVWPWRKTILTIKNKSGETWSISFSENAVAIEGSSVPTRKNYDALDQYRYVAMSDCMFHMQIAETCTK